MAMKINVGSGLVEIAALTALVGSTTAESLVLGDRGAAGMAWAAMSTFGSLFLIKACVAAATPGWLRDTVGVRNSRCDSAVGLSLSLDRHTKRRGLNSEAVGASVQVREHLLEDENSGEKSQLGYQIGIQRDIYHVDGYTAAPLRACPVSLKNSAALPYLYCRDPHWIRTNRRLERKDWIGLILSSVKLSEVYVLWYYDAHPLAYITGINWAFFFLAAISIQVLHLSREHRPKIATDTLVSCIDIVGGKLPTVQCPGEDLRILLGVPLNARKSLPWRISWALGSLVCFATTVTIYMIIGDVEKRQFYIWVGFQVLWLLLRSVYFHLADETDDVKHVVAPVPASSPKGLMIPLRMLALATAVSRHQTLSHPRGHSCYSQDCQNALEVMSVLRRSKFKLCLETGSLFQCCLGEDVEIQVLAVLGDTLLSCVAWMQGLNLTSMELYDTSLIALEIGGEVFVVPCARVLSGPPKSAAPKDLEINHSPNFVSRGGSNDGINVSWVFWISAGNGLWLYLKPGLDFTGQKTATVLDDMEVTRRLEVGDLWIGLKSVQDIKAVVEISITAGEALCAMVVETT